MTSRSSSTVGTSPGSPPGASSARPSSPGSWPSSTCCRAAGGDPPLLLLDDVFSELDPQRRAHLVRRIGGLPQAFVTTTALEDLDPALVRASTAWRVEPGRLERRGMTRRPMRRLSDLLPEAVAALGIGDELVAAGRERTFEALVEELVPAAAGAMRAGRAATAPAHRARGRPGDRPGAAAPRQRASGRLPDATRAPLVRPSCGSSCASPDRWVSVPS